MYSDYDFTGIEPIPLKSTKSSKIEFQRFNVIYFRNIALGVCMYVCMCVGFKRRGVRGSTHLKSWLPVFGD